MYFPSRPRLPVPSRRLGLTAAALLGLLLAPPALGEPDIPTARVVLPWSDFKTLYDKGMAPEDKPEAAPRDYAITTAEYDGVVGEDSTVFNARMRVNVLKREGWSVVPLLPTSVALKSARVKGQDASIYLDGGWYMFVTDRPGEVSIDLEFAVSTWESSGQNGFTFGLARSAGTRVRLVVPDAQDLDFQVAGAQRITQDAKGGNTTLDALLPATGNLAVSWQREAPEAPADAVETARVYAEHQALIGVSEGVLEGHSTIEYSILHAGVEKLAVALPQHVTVLDVTGKGIRDWTVSKFGPLNRIDVDLNFEAKGAYTLQVAYEHPLAEGVREVEVPRLTVLDVERVKGWVGVDARSNLEIAAGDIGETRVVDVRELPANILGRTDWPVLLGFKYRSDQWKIPLQVRQHEEVDMLVTLVDQLAATTVMTPDGRRMTRVTWAMRNNRAQYLRVSLPEGATPWSTFVAGKAVKPARAEDGRVMVPLARSQATGGDLARFAVEMVYVEDGTPPSESGKGSFSARLPDSDVPSTSVAWTIYIPDEAKVRSKTIEGALRQVDWFTPIDVGGATSQQAVEEVQRQANATFEGEGMAGGVQPVRVTLPLDGTPYHFEKLLVLDETLDVRFDYKNLK